MSSYTPAQNYFDSRQQHDSHITPTQHTTTEDPLNTRTNQFQHYRETTLLTTPTYPLRPVVKCRHRQQPVQQFIP